VVVVSPEEVRRIARLAKLTLAPDEEARLSGQLSRILDAMDELAALDAEPDPPAARAAKATALRPDLVRAGIPREEALAAAPDADPESGTFRVPAVLDTESDA
jgi:aspartyl-tRNA(Asn)/glutamyl-tRNA(Gln) amidotransferase subunit C